MKKNKINAKDLDTIMLISVVLFICTFAIFLFFKTTDFTELVGIEKIFFQAMRYYMVFLFARLAVHLLFSFADKYFSKKIEKNDNFPLVTIIIPCYNEEKVINNAVKSTLAISYPNIEILLVDDGSIDATAEVIALLESKGSIRVIHQENAGKAAALNRAISEAHGDYVFCMDADSVINSDALQIGMKYFQTDPKIAAVAGSVEIGNVKNFITSFQRLEYISGLNLYKTAQSFFGKVTVIPGPIGLFKKSIIQEVGGYRSNTFAEDCELTVRLLINNYKTVYDSEMIALTEAPEDFQALVSQRYRWSRGVVQAIRENIFWLFHPFKNISNFFVILYLVIESIFIPILNFLFGIFAISHTLVYGTHDFMGYFFMQLIILDVVLTLFCVVNEKQSVKLLFYSAINRVTYGFSIEVIRFFSILDEILQLPMTWAKLERKGLDV